MVKNRSARKKARNIATELATDLKEVAECSSKTVEEGNFSKNNDSSGSGSMGESNSEPDSSSTAPTTSEVNLISFSETSTVNKTTTNSGESTIRAQVSAETFSLSEDVCEIVQDDFTAKFKSCSTEANTAESISKKSLSPICETRGCEGNTQSTSEAKPDEESVQNCNETGSITKEGSNQEEIEVCQKQIFKDCTPCPSEAKYAEEGVQNRSNPRTASIAESKIDEVCSTNKEARNVEEIAYSILAFITSKVRRSDGNDSHKNLISSIFEDTVSSKVDLWSSLPIEETSAVDGANDEVDLSQEDNHEESEASQKIDENHKELDVCQESKIYVRKRKNSENTEDGKLESQSSHKKAIPPKKSCRNMFLLDNSDKGEQKPVHFLNAEATISIAAVVFGTVFVYALITNYREIETVFRAPHYLYHKTRGNFSFTWLIVFALCIPFFHVISLGIEKALVTKKISETMGTAAYICNTLFVLTFPLICFKYVATTNELNRAIVIVMYIYTVMKMLSFWKWNYVNRQTWKQQTTAAKCETGKNRQNTYPENLCLNNVIRYSIVPNYCYQPEFPRRPFKVSRMLKTLAMSYLQAEIAANLIEHVVTPILEDYTEDWGFFNWSSTDQLLDELRTVILISPILGLIVLVTLNATLFGTLNMLAEFSGYDHNGFNGDWWNAVDMQQYWSRWNYPIHEFLREMVYIPIKTRWSPSRFQCNLVVFFVSGIFHDYGVMGIIGNYYALWVTLSMIFQAFNIEATHYLRKKVKYGTMIANMFVIAMWPIGTAACFLFIYKKNVSS